MHVTEMTGR